MSFYTNYDKGSVGNILHFLYHICGLNAAEMAMVDFKRKQITYHSEVLATFREGDDGFPEFDFINKEIYPPEAVAANRAVAISDWKKYSKYSSERILW